MTPALQNSPNLKLPSKFSELDHKDVWIRAAKTGITVFVITLLGSLANLGQLPSLSDWHKFIIAALSAAGTAILNYVLQLT